MEEIEIPGGAYDSETMGWEYTIPDDMEAKIEDGKIIVRKKESEDERIRKELIEFIKKQEGQTLPADKYDSWLAYLEKQKEQKLVEWNDEDMREARENLIACCCDWERGEATTLLPIVATRARYFLERHIGPSAEWLAEFGFEQNGYDPVRVLKSIKEKCPMAWEKVLHQEWNEEDEKMRQRLIASLGRIGANTRTDSTSVNYCFIEEIAWLESLRPVKQEWSEEDELNLQSCIAKIEIDMQRWGDNGKTMVDGDRKLIDWLKSLRHQARQEQTAEEKEYVRTIKSLVADAIRATERVEVKDEVHGKIIAQSGPNITFYQRLIDWVEGRHVDQTIAWKKYEDGHRFDSDTVVIGLDRSEPRLVRCAVSACYGIAVKDLLKLPFCL